MIKITPKKILLVSFIALAVTIPLVVRFIAGQSLLPDSISGPKASPKPPSSTVNPLDEIKRLSEQPGSTDSSSSGLLPNVTFGPTLNIRLIFEGRPTDNQAVNQVFVGLASGQPTTNPTYLLSFTIDFPASGLFSGLSLAGLNTGNTYTAYIKGPSQIATASAFTMGANQTNLNSAQPLTLLAGDLNDDNTINSADYSIAKGLFGASSKSANWNERADLNVDGVINSADIAYVVKNFGKTGNSGIWISSPVSTQSGGLNIPIPEASPSGKGGYWLFVPNI